MGLGHGQRIAVVGWLMVGIIRNQKDIGWLGSRHEGLRHVPCLICNSWGPRGCIVQHYRPARFDESGMGSELASEEWELHSQAGKNRNLVGSV